MREEWKPIDGYEDCYAVSNYGRVKSFSRMRNGRLYEGKVLTQKRDNNGYCQIRLYKDGERKYYRVHRLVAKAFVQNIENKQQVNHLDEVKHNNHFTNLEWSTPLENTRHGTGIHRMKKSMPKKAIIGIPLLGGESLYFASTAEARRAGFSSVQHALSGRRKYHKGYEWQYAK